MKWVILNEFAHYEFEENTFEKALIEVLNSQAEGWESYRYIVNEEQFKELEEYGVCEGGLEIVNGVMKDVEEILDGDRLHEIELEEEQRLYWSAVEDARPSTFPNCWRSLLEVWRESNEH